MMEESHTAVYIRKLICDVLKDYGLTAKNVYTTTTDNGSNMVKLSTLIEKEQNSILPEISQMEEEYEEIEERSSDESEEISDDVVDDFDDNNSDNDSNDNDIANNDNTNGDTININEESVLNALENELKNDLNSGGIHEGVRCAAHTIQLAVWDVLKKKTHKRTIAKVPIPIILLKPN